LEKKLVVSALGSFRPSMYVPPSALDNVNRNRLMRVDESRSRATPATYDEEGGCGLRSDSVAGWNV